MAKVVHVCACGEQYNSHKQWKRHKSNKRSEGAGVHMLMSQCPRPNSHR
jgi:hypothetical protein